MNVPVQQALIQEHIRLYRQRPAEMQAVVLLLASFEMRNEYFDSDPNLSDLLDSPGTTIAAFCNSGVCFGVP